MALIGVILLLILASGVCAALAVSGKTETMAAYNLDASAQAHMAAQAGLTAAVEVVITNLNTTALDPTDAVNNLLEGPDDDAAATADNGNLATIDGVATGLPVPGTRLQLGTLQGVSYTVQAFDEDDPARGLTLSPAAITEIDENSSRHHRRQQEDRDPRHRLRPQQHHGDARGHHRHDHAAGDRDQRRPGRAGQPDAGRPERRRSRQRQPDARQRCSGDRRGRHGLRHRRHPRQRERGWPRGRRAADQDRAAGARERLLRVRRLPARQRRRHQERPDAGGPGRSSLVWMDVGRRRRGT